MASLAEFSIDDLEVFSAALRTIGEGAGGMEAAADRVTTYLYEQLRGRDGGPGCVSVTLHLTHPFEDLPAGRRAQATFLDPGARASTTCLTPLSIVGHADEVTAGSTTVPLTDAGFATRPILLSLVAAMGLTRRLVTERSEALLSGVHRQELEAFLLPDVRSTDLLGREERVRAAEVGIESLVGIGGGLPTGDLFVLLLSARDVVTDKAAYLLRPIASAIKATLIPHALHPWP